MPASHASTPGFGETTNVPYATILCIDSPTKIVYNMYQQTVNSTGPGPGPGNLDSQVLLLLHSLVLLQVLLTMSSSLVVHYHTKEKLCRVKLNWGALHK